MYRDEHTPYDTLKHVTWQEGVLAVVFAVLGLYMLTVIPAVETWNPKVVFGIATILLLAIVVPVSMIYRASLRRSREILTGHKT